MLKEQLLELWKKLRFPRRLKVLLRPWPRIRRLINTWPRLILLFVLAFVFLYYPLGALISEDIDTNTDYEIAKDGHRSATIDTMTFLIKREVYNKSWTPALPFIFPAYMLDNMPAFQLGIMEPIGHTAKVLAAKMDKSIAEEGKSPLHSAAELLQYPGTIWMFSPSNKLIPAPSSNSQYRRARKQLQNYNHMLADGQAIFEATPQNLLHILKAVKADLQKTSNRLESHIRENSSSWLDTKADDVFYYQQGKIYAYFLLLKALSFDFKDAILQSNIYQPWTSLLKSLENAAHLSPTIVRNGELDSLLAPNHLASLGFYSRKAIITLQKMLTTLDGVK